MFIILWNENCTNNTLNLMAFISQTSHYMCTKLDNKPALYNYRMNIAIASCQWGISLREIYLSRVDILIYTSHDGNNWFIIPKLLKDGHV